MYSCVFSTMDMSHGKLLKFLLLSISSFTTSLLGLRPVPLGNDGHHQPDSQSTKDNHQKYAKGLRDIGQKMRGTLKNSAYLDTCKYRHLSIQCNNIYSNELVAVLGQFLNVSTWACNSSHITCVYVSIKSDQKCTLLQGTMHQNTYRTGLHQVHQIFKK